MSNASVEEVTTAAVPLRIFGATFYAVLSTLSIALNSILVRILVKVRTQTTQTVLQSV